MVSMSRRVPPKNRNQEQYRETHVIDPAGQKPITLNPDLVKSTLQIRLDVEATLLVEPGANHPNFNSRRQRKS